MRKKYQLHETPQYVLLPSFFATTKILKILKLGTIQAKWKIVIECITAHATPLSRPLWLGVIVVLSCASAAELPLTLEQFF